jgi:hypothetical protein
MLMQVMLEADSKHMQEQQRFLQRTAHYTVQVLDEFMGFGFRGLR